MHILYIHQYFKTPEQPGITRSYEMARRYVEAGHRVTMISSDTFAPAEGDWYVTQEAGIEVHWLPMPYSNHMEFGRRKRVFLKFALKAALRALKIKADLVFATSTPLTVGLPALMYRFWRRVPMVFEVRDLWPEIPIAMGGLTHPLEIGLARFLERSIYRRSSRILALSPGMADGVVRSGYPREQVSVVSNACDIELFDVGEEPGRQFRATRSWLSDRPLVVYTGTLGYANATGYLVELAGHMLDINPEVCFLLVGDGVEKEHIRTLAEQKGVLGLNFFMMDEVSKAEIPAILSAATIAVSTMIDLRVIWDNSANKFFDALASGTPVMINYGGWQAEWLETTGAGFVADPYDHARAAAHLQAFISDPERMRKATEAAGKLAREEFNRDKLADKALKVLQQALS